LKGRHSEITHHVAPNEKTIDENFLEDDEAAEETISIKRRKPIEENQQKGNPVEKIQEIVVEEKDETIPENDEEIEVVVVVTESALCSPAIRHFHYFVSCDET
jgi:high-affinity K+ transport system ATPase subunit B